MRLLTKRTYLLVFAIVALAFPAAAFAAGLGSGSSSGAIGSAAAVSQRGPAVDFQRLSRAFAQRFERRRRAAETRRRFANLPGDVSIQTLESIASCESGGDPAAVSSDGTYRGKYQFDFGTWESVGGHGDPAAAPEAEQDYRAALLYARSGSSPWPICG